MIRKLKVFVTGGAGFIGRHCAKSFLEKKSKVTIFDNFSNSSKSMISDLLNDGAELVKGDITIQDEVSSAISGHDIVIHLAAQSNVEDSIKNPEKTFAVNVDGTKNVLHACVKQNIKSIIAASSAAVYGETKDSPVSESHKTNPLSPYGESKLKMEQLVQSFSKKNNLNSIILRIFNVYGKGQTAEYAGVITKFIDKISKNKNLEIFGDGLQRRDFVSIYDVIDAIHCSVLKIDKNPGRVYNVASGKSISVNELAKIMISISGKNLNISHLEPLKNEIRFSQADISLAKNELNFVSKRKLKDEIKELLNKRLN